MPNRGAAGEFDITGVRQYTYARCSFLGVSISLYARLILVFVYNSLAVRRGLKRRPGAPRPGSSNAWLLTVEH